MDWKTISVQQYLLIGTGVVLILLLLFPPFEFTGSTSNIRNSAGYSFILAPPSIHTGFGGRRFATVNLRMLLTEYLVVVTVGVLFQFAFRSK